MQVLPSNCLKKAKKRYPGVSQSDLQQILRHLTGLTSAQLIADQPFALTSTLWKKYHHFLSRREAGEPIPYLFGECDFWTLSLQVSPAVLIPRHETEHLVECALSLYPANKVCHCLDLGTGSGAIALALALERSQWDVLATDKSPAAIQLAQANAKKNHIKQVNFLVSDWFLAIKAKKQFDLIVSNPPYVAVNAPELAAGVADYEPQQALFSANAGTADLAQIIHAAPYYLRSGAYLLLEHAYDQAHFVKDCLRNAGFTEVQTYQDYAGLDRISWGRYTRGTSKCYVSTE